MDANNDSKEGQLHARPDPNMKLSVDDWRRIRDLVIAGEDATKLAEEYEIKPNTIHRRASQEKWPTPNRVLKAQKRGLPSGDPASEIAALWSKRQGKAREDVFQGSKKALERFFASSPVPQSFSEAQVAERMMMKAIDPSEGKAQMDDPNLQLLAGDDDGMVIDVEEVPEEQPLPISHQPESEEQSIPTTPIPPNTPTTSPDTGLSH